jgi:ferredoxin
MRFTMAQPEVSCHPETLLDGRAHGRLGRALLLRAAPEPAAGGRLPRYAWRDHYALLRERLDALGRGSAALPRARRREPARRPRGAERVGVGFYGKNTMLITRDARLVGRARDARHDVELEPTPPLDAGCGRCTLCIDACPTGALDEPGVLDATRCLSYWTQAPAMPDDVMDALEDRVYGCDICQEVCRGTRGREAPRRALPSGETRRCLARDWLREEGELIEELDRLYVPRTTPLAPAERARRLGNAGWRRRALAVSDDESPRRGALRGGRVPPVAERGHDPATPRAGCVVATSCGAPSLRSPRSPPRPGHHRPSGGCSRSRSRRARDVERISPTRARVAPLERGRRRGARGGVRGPAVDVSRRPRPSCAATRRASARCSRTSSRTRAPPRTRVDRGGEATAGVVVTVADDGAGRRPAARPVRARRERRRLDGLRPLARARDRRGARRRRSSSSEPPAGRAFRLLCRPLPPRAEPELRLERLALASRRPSHRRRLEHARSRRGRRAPRRGATPPS